MNILTSLEWRYATKAFDSTKKISEEQLHSVLEAGRLAPSSYGLEPWKFIVVQNEELRTRLKEVSWNQSQVTDASHLIVLATKKTMTASDIDAFIERIAQTRGVETSALVGYADIMKSSILGRSPEAILEWNKRQVYIALGYMMETAALLEIDTCPMEGFDAQAYDVILGLSDTDYTATVLLPVGFRLDSDAYATLKKVRKSMSDVVVKM